MGFAKYGLESRRFLERVLPARRISWRIVCTALNFLLRPLERGKGADYSSGDGGLDKKKKR